MIKINVGTYWEAEFDPSIKPEDFVEVTVWHGKNKGLWRVVEVENRVVDHSNRGDFGGQWNNTTRKREFAPTGMHMPPLLKLQRIMDDEYDRPYRRDRSERSSEHVVKVTPEYIANIQAGFDTKVAHLNELLAGTWVV